jgi:DNA repair protein RadC
MKTVNKSIKHWALDDRPREKMMQKGVEALSDSELLAILINNGTRDRSALQLSKDLLSACENNISKLAKFSIKEIEKLNIKGIGPAKAVTIKAALELSSRRVANELRKDVLLTSKDVAEYLRTKLRDKKHEVFVVLFLNRMNKVNHYAIISEGGITGTIADPRIILKKALEHDAVSIILSHNHPSGSLHPSQADEMLTAKIKEAARYLEIKVLDHIIVSEDGYFSFADEGIL